MAIHNLAPPQYCHRGGIWKKTMRYAPLTFTMLASLIPLKFHLHGAIIREGISLHGALYHHRLLDYRAEERPALLNERRRLNRNPAFVSWVFDRTNAFVDKRMARDVASCLPAVDQQALVQLR